MIKILTFSPKSLLAFRTAPAVLLGEILSVVILAVVTLGPTSGGFAGLSRLRLKSGTKPTLLDLILRYGDEDSSIFFIFSFCKTNVANIS